MAASEDKLDLLRSLLKDNPNLGMKEANLVIREQFGTGVAPPQYSKVKKELEGNAEQSDESSKSEEAIKSKRKTKKSKTKEAKVEEEVTSETNNDLESFFDGSQAKKVEDQDKNEQNKEIENSIETSETQENEEEAQEVEVEEDLPPLPTHPVKLEVIIPNANTVHLAGSFNKWKVEDYPLSQKEDSNWVFDDELPEGDHFYKFVIDKKTWHLDLSKEYFVDPTGISHKLTVSANS